MTRTLSHLTPHNSSEGRSKSGIIYPHFSTSKEGPGKCGELATQYSVRVPEELGLDIILPSSLASCPDYNNPTTSLALWGSSKRLFNKPSLSSRLWVLIIVLEMARFLGCYVLSRWDHRQKPGLLQVKCGTTWWVSTQEVLLDMQISGSNTRQTWIQMLWNIRSMFSSSKLK